MAITGITTTLTDTKLGTPVADENICMLIAPAVDATSATDGYPTFTTGMPFLITSLENANNIGIVSNYDTTANGQIVGAGINLRFNIEEFYAKAGTGAKLWIYGIPATENVFPALDDFFEDTFPQVIRQTASIQGYANRPRIVGVVQNLTTPTETPIGGGLSTETVSAISAFESALESSFSEAYRMVGILDSSWTDEIGNLPDTSTYNAGRVALAITTSTPGKSASVGRALGILASRNISVSIGNVTMGSISTADYFMDYTGESASKQNTSVTLPSRADIDSVASKQYLFTRERPGAGGIFYNDGATCNLSTNALSSIEFVRVGNAVCDDMDTFFTNLINTNVPVTNSGDIDPVYKQTILAQLDNQYISPRIARGDVSNINVDFIAQNNNFVATRTFVVTVEILPNASMKEAFINVFYVTSLT